MLIFHALLTGLLISVKVKVIRVVDLNSQLIWKALLVISIGITIVSLLSLIGLRENISGDGIPNRPQGGPPIEYSWDKAMQRLLVAIFSTGTAFLSWNRITKSRSLARPITY